MVIYANTDDKKRWNEATRADKPRVEPFFG
jgi:hypothetical protein